MNKKFVCFLLPVLFLNTAFAQVSAADGALDTLFKLNPKSVLLKSLLLPGAGQVSQERLWTATLYYGVSLTFYVKSVNAYSEYLNTSDKNDLNEFYNNLTIAGLTHLINIADAYYFAYIKDVKGWDGTLFSDKSLKSPWGATVRSLMLPGWGQWYNESYLKAAGYVAAVAFFANEIYKNKSALDKSDVDKSLIKKYKDDYSRYSWYLGFTYLLMLMDAHVDAYLYKFDEAIKLSFLTQNNITKVGLTVYF